MSATSSRCSQPVEPFGRPAIAYVWAYRVEPDHAADFRHAYGPEGEWVTFFRRSDGFLGTDLLEDSSDPTRFVTVDYFVDKEARRRLVAENHDEFIEVDQRWEAVTIEEVFLGEFTVRAR